MIELFNGSNALDFEKFVLSQPNSLIHYSCKYQTLLKHFLEADPCYFISRNGSGAIEGVLPAFLKRNEMHGNVMNSLPFYGSHGSVLAHERKKEIKQGLIEAFYSYAEQNNCVSTTLITSPFETDQNYYENEVPYTFKDERIGQMVRLPPKSVSTSEALMSMYHSKTRNMVRKAQKLPIQIITDGADRYHDFLMATHKENMHEVGGIAKPITFFNLIREIFQYNKEYRIYTAMLDDKPIAALLLLYYNNAVEYFTPVVLKEYRAMQPLSLLIYQAMQDAVLDGFKWWNWGGTWLTQDGVYHFKKRWGTEDFPYFYYTRVYSDKILSLDSTILLKEYPYFFTVPFSELKA